MAFTISAVATVLGYFVAAMVLLLVCTGAATMMIARGARKEAQTQVLTTGLLALDRDGVAGLRPVEGHEAPRVRVDLLDDRRLGVRGPVTSPTFVIARVHPSLGDGPPLVHVDAYRLGGGLDEMEDLDLDVSLPDSVIVVEWGDGKVEELSEDRLHVLIHRAVGDTTDEVREVTLRGIGERWAAADLTVLSA